MANTPFTGRNLTMAELAQQNKRLGRQERNRIAIKRLRKQGNSWAEIGKFYGVEPDDMAAFEQRFASKPKTPFSY